MHRRTLVSTFASPCAAGHGGGPTSRRRLSKLLRPAVAAVLALYLMAVPTSAEAQGDVITIDFDDVVFAPAGSVVPVGSVAVAPDLQGNTCRTSVITANQSSIHPDNNLLISTGGSTTRIEDVEDFTNGTNSWLVDITLGSVIDMAVQMGPDGISSLGFAVEIDCSDPLVGSTAPVLASTVTTSTTTTSTTTTTTTTTTSNTPTTTVDGTTSDTTESTTTTSLAPSSSQLQLQETTTTAAATISSTTAPTVTVPPTTTTSPAETTSTTAAPGQLEQSSPASAVPAQPSYTG